MAEIQTSTWSETAASNNSATPDGWPEGQTAASVNNCAREMMAVLKREYNRHHATVTSGGSADAQTLTYTTAPAAYTSGAEFKFYAGYTNATATPTLNVNALGTKTIVRGDGTALKAGDILSGAITTVVYDGTNFRLLADRIWPVTGTLSSSGGLDFPDGLKLRWGSGTVGAAGDTLVSYSGVVGTTLQVFPSVLYAGTGGAPDLRVSSGLYTSTGFTLGSSGALDYNYYAICLA